jgi:poly(3-hydroxybutyrate) depolymerase
MIISKRLIAAAGSALFASCAAQSPPQPTLQTAAHHPMQYYISLPEGWSAGKKWPVVIALEGGNKNFLDMEQAYIRARRAMPFIIVTPVILTNGGYDLRGLPNYHYADAVWDEAERTGKCRFDLEGLSAVIDDAQSRYGGEPGVFITGHSAGGHLAWAMAFQHPEKLAAVALTCGNYAGRCMTEENFSRANERINLRVNALQGEIDPVRVPLEDQFRRAASAARQHGYKNVSYEIVHGGAHERFADQVLVYFNSVRFAK